MMGRQVGEAQLFYIFSVERHVPADHLLRRVDAVLDLSFMRTSLAEHYSCTGRPSIDPELMIRMLLVGYLYGIRSETRLCEEVHLNLAFRWFCRLGDGDVPERSTFSKNRHGRFREGDVFRRLFEEVVRCCVAARLVGGTGAAVDGSVVEADASRERRLPSDHLPEAWSNRESQARPVREYLDALDAASTPARDEPKQAAPKHISETDPQAAWSIKTGQGRFRYETNYLVDTAHAVILDVEATPARLSQEIVAAKRMLQRTRARLGLTPHRTLRSVFLQYPVCDMRKVGLWSGNIGMHDLASIRSSGWKISRPSPPKITSIPAPPAPWIFRSLCDVGRLARVDVVLRAAKELGNIGLGTRLRNSNPPFLHLTEQGRSALAQFSRDPANPDGYLEYVLARMEVG